MTGAGRDGQGGFSLIEVLAALAILGIVLGMSWQALGTGVRAVEAAATRARALEVARSTLAAVMARDMLAPGTWSGPAGDMTWTTTVQPQRTVTLAPPPSMASAGPTAVIALSVTVTVTWDADRSVSLSTIKLSRAP